MNLFQTEYTNGTHKYIRLIYTLCKFIDKNLHMCCILCMATVYQNQVKTHAHTNKDYKTLLCALSHTSHYSRCGITYEPSLFVSYSFSRTMHNFVSSSSQNVLVSHTSCLTCQPKTFSTKITIFDFPCT